jgi:hypothetical protein
VPLATDGAPIDEPSGGPDPVDDGVLIGCVIEADGAGVLDMPPPHAAGCSFVPAGDLDPSASSEPESPAAVMASGCAPPEASEEAADAEGGGTVRSLWQ